MRRSFAVDGGEPDHLRIEPSPGSNGIASVPPIRGEDICFGVRQMIFAMIGFGYVGLPLAEDFGKKLVKGGCLIDVKAAFDPLAFLASEYSVWRL